MKKIIAGFLLVIPLLVPVVSDAAVTQTLSISNPRPYQTVEKGSELSIAWKTTGIEKINLYYSKRNSEPEQLIQQLVPAEKNSFVWKVPTSFPQFSIWQRPFEVWCRYRAM